MRVCSCILLFVFPAGMIASDAIGTLVSDGAVTIDGMRSSSGTVFAGDNIRTGDPGRAVVTGRGMIITLAPNSDLTLGAGTLDLGTGTVVINSGQTAVRVNGTRIATTRKEGGKFLVQRANDSLKIVALKGDLSVGEGAQQTTVPAASGVNVPSAAGGTKSGSAVPHASWLSNAELGTLIAVAAAIAAGVAVGIVNSQNAPSASPSTP